MRLLVINPDTSAEMTAALDRAARTAARPDVDVETVMATAGPRSIDGQFDEAMSAAGGPRRRC